MALEPHNTIKVVKQPNQLKMCKHAILIWGKNVLKALCAVLALQLVFFYWDIGHTLPSTLHLKAGADGFTDLQSDQPPSAERRGL